jgi:hypothetical protein
MDPKARQQVLRAVILVCLIAIAFWWFQSQYGPGGRHRYGIVRASWTNQGPGVGDLVLALDRAPAADLAGGKIVSFTPGLVVNASETLSIAGAKTVASLLPKIAGRKISSVDASAHTITYSAITPPSGWPVVAPAPPAPKTWTATTTTASKGKASASMNVAPVQKGG